jgi:hypothetical protein
VLESLACREGLALAQYLHQQRTTVAEELFSNVDFSRPFDGIYSSVFHKIKEASTLLEEMSLDMKIELRILKHIG